jgi:hypothetical protein
MLESPDVFAARIRRETTAWAALIRSRNISAQ